MIYSKKLISAAMIVLALFAAFAIACELTATESNAAISSAAKKKAKTYTKKANKIFKVNGAKYCFSSRKVRTGQRKVGSYYYFFNKSTGKMMKKKAYKIGKKVFYFKANGRRYKYGYKSTGTAKGNAAAGLIISLCGIKPKATPTAAQLKKAYVKIGHRTDYAVLPTPNLNNRKWIAKSAYRAAMKKSGKCYNYAALTYVTFKALGASPKLIAGKVDRGTGNGPGAHSWVTIKNSAGNTLIYDTNYDRKNAAKNLKFFAKKFTYDKEAKAYKVAGQSYDYYINKTF